MKYNLLELRYKDFLYYVFWISLLQGVISSYLGFNKISYVCDLLLIGLVIVTLFRINSHRVRLKGNISYLPILLFSIVVVVGWNFNPASGLMALWAIRNYGRFFLYYFFCNAFLNSEDIEKIENVFLKTFPFHILLIIYQYFVEHLVQDTLNGIFGTEVGGNAGLVLYLSIVMCIIMTRYAYKRISLFSFILYLILIFINAALSELKYLFIVAVILLGWYLLMIRKKERGIFLALFFVGIIYIAIQIFYIVFPYFVDFLSFDSLINQFSEQAVYSSANDVGRTAVFSKLTPIITQWTGKEAVWVGIGLGNADYSSAISVLNSAFFIEYENMHYTWLSLGYLFVETGYLGVIAYTMFFIILEICAIKKYQKKNTYENLLGTFFPLICMIMLVYNSVLRSNYAYIIFVTLSWNLVNDKKVNKIY